MFLDKKDKQSAFTIVELLVVIVVIGILAAITVVSYTGITRKALVSTLQSDLKNNLNLLEMYKAENDTYPATAGLANSGQGLKSSPNVTLNYVYQGANSYCVDVNQSGIYYYVNSSTQTPAEGRCFTSLSSVYGSGDTDYTMGSALAGDGSYYVVGDVYGTGAGGFDVFVTKYDASGNVSWTKTWGGTGSDYSTGISITSDGGFVISGYTYSYTAGNTDGFVAKFSNSGALSWSRTLGSTNADAFNSVVVASDGSIYVTGNSLGLGSGGGDVILAKYTTDGTLSWSKSWGSASEDVAKAIIESTDGYIYIAGYTYSYGSGQDDAFLAKFDTTGSLVWSRTLGNSLYDQFLSIDKISNGGIIAVGEGDAGASGDREVMIAKYDSAGALSWYKTYGGSARDKVYSVKAASDGSYILAGYTASFGAGSNDAFISKNNSDGTLAWFKTWGGTGSDEYRSILLPGNGFISTGTGYGLGTGSSYSDYSLNNYNNDGTINNCSSPLCQSISPSQDRFTAIANSPAATTTNLSPSTTSPSASSQSITFVKTILSQ